MSYGSSLLLAMPDCCQRSDTLPAMYYYLDKASVRPPVRLFCLVLPTRQLFAAGFFVRPIVFAHHVWHLTQPSFVEGASMLSTGRR